MTDQAKSLFEQARKLSASERQELAELLLDTLEPDPIEVDADTLAALDEGCAQVERGELVPAEDVARFFARFHK